MSLSRLSYLEIPEERRKGVIENFNRIELVAQVVSGVALAPEDELGPEWRP